MATPSLLYSPTAQAPNFNGTLNLTTPASALPKAVAKPVVAATPAKTLTAPSLVNANAAWQNNVQGPAGTPVAPTLTGGSNGTVSTTAGLSGPSAVNGANLYNSLNASFDNSPQESTIMSQYQQATAAAQANAAAAGQQITDTSNQNLDYQSGQDKAQGTQMLEAQRGFAVNPGSIALLQSQSTQRIKELTTQMNDALANNNTALASQLADLSLQENSAITNARTSFLNNYFDTQGEARSQSNLPLSQASTAAGTQATLAGAASSLAGAALTKAQANSVTAFTPAQVEEALAAAGASAAGANASNANASQTNALTSFLKVGTTGTSDPNVQSLLSGQATPQQIQDKYPTNIYGGYAAAIISAAQSAGYNLNAGTLSARSQANTTDALSSGNPFSLGGAILSQGLGSVGGLLTGSSQAIPAGTDGAAYGYPGYKSDGTQWVQK